MINFWTLTLCENWISKCIGSECEVYVDEALKIFIYIYLISLNIFLNNL